MASPPNSPGQGESGETGEPSSSAAPIACNRCRRAKLRCSRERPACTHCSRADQECVYESKRMRPGVKTGAIETIYKRLDKLEQDAQTRDLEHRGQGLAPSNGNDSLPANAAESVLALLARELPKLIQPARESGPQVQQHEEAGTSVKRRRTEDDAGHAGRRPPRGERPPLPANDLMPVIIDTYFTHIHPWVPMLHQDRFRERVSEMGTSQPTLKLRLILQAITLAVARYLPVEDTSPDVFPDPEWPAEGIRDWVILTAQENVFLEGLQALILIAFNDIGNGNATRAWPLVASLSRTVEFAQLTMEHDNGQRQPVCPPFSYLDPSRDWTEQEERRRVFWNVFLLDRFCSITMGWNTSLTSIDVHQRLPCDGILWRKHEAVLTPYLGIWDKSTGGISNKSRGSFHQPERTSALDTNFWTQPIYSSPGQAEVDMSRVGAFGYCVEATESMSRVTSYLLQQRIDPSDPAQVNAWLARFKELDLRLVHWKMFLPEKWKPNAAQDSAPHATAPQQASRMDPNLTLAHITHNASTILLHQVIAYPPAHWPFRRRLPSAWSAETCCSAGVQIATITRKYLETTPSVLPITSPFAFCVYLAARMMLVHWRHDAENSLMDEYWALLRCLEDMSRRWRAVSTTSWPQNSPSPASLQGHDLAGKYAARLYHMYKCCVEDENYRISVTAYTQEVDHRVTIGTPEDTGHRSSIPAAPRLPVPSPGLPGSFVPGQNPWSPNAPGCLMGLLPNMPPDGSYIQQQHREQPPPNLPPAQFGVAANGQVPEGTPDSQQFAMAGDGVTCNSLDKYFLDMDRVIAFDDGGFFTGELENGAW